MNSVYLSKIQSNISLLNSNIEKTTNQVASGKKFQEGSEDIEAFNLHLQIKEDLKTFKTVTNDIAYGKNYLSNSENAIDTMENLMNTMYTSMSKMASNATYNEIERDIILEEFKGIRSQMVSLANTNINGQYIFSGSFTERAPFDPENVKQNSDTLAYEMVYQGDNNSKEVYVDKNYKKDFSITGQELFVDSKLFEKVDEIINLLENTAIETSRELNALEKMNNKIVGSSMITDIYDDLQKLDFSQLSVDQKLNITEYSKNLENYIKVPNLENYKLIQSQHTALATNPGDGSTGPWDYATELDVMFDLAEYNVSLNTYSGGEKILNDTAVNQPWPTGVGIEDALEVKFTLNNAQDLNNVKIDLGLFDPNGSVHIAINGKEILEIPNHNGTSQITLADLKGEIFSKGENTLQIWSDTGDTGTLENFKVYTDSNKDLFEQKDSMLENHAAFFTQEQKEDLVYQYNMTMYKVDLKEYIDSPTTENLEAMKLSRDFINNEITQENVEQWKVNQKDKYEPIILNQAALLNTYVTQINGGPDISAINDYVASIQDYMDEPTQVNFTAVKDLRDTLVGSTFTSTVINPVDEVENMFDYVEYLNDSQPWSSSQVSGELKKTNDYMFGLANNPFSAKIADLNEVQGRISGIRGKLGNTYNYLDNMEAKINSKTLELQKFYSDNVDADMSQVATRLSQETNALNALYSVVAKLQSLSLTNYLK